MAKPTTIKEADALKAVRYEEYYLARFRSEVVMCENALQVAKEKLALAERRKAAGEIVIDDPVPRPVGIGARIGRR